MLMERLRRIDKALYVHFFTSSCYHRRRLLDQDQSKRILLGVLNDEVEECDARCVGFVVTPDHVRALIWFSRTGQLSRFMQQWKGHSSKGIKQFLWEAVPAYAARFPRSDPIRKVRLYSFKVYSPAKIEENLTYMHLNPVRAGLASKAVEWRWSSARWYIEGRTVGVPIQWAD
jgi:putative transposase